MTFKTEKLLILTVNASHGGSDAKQFAEILTNMYKRWFKKNNIQYKLEENYVNEGLTAATFFFEKAPANLDKEHGIHKLIRISPFGKKQLRQTSFCEVIPDEIDTNVSLDPNWLKQIKIETFKASGPGGQHVNKTESAVRITHIPTGLQAVAQADRNQSLNKAAALQTLERKLILWFQKKNKPKITLKLKRTYVFDPNQYVKNEDTGFKSFQLQDILDGKLDLISGL